MPNLSEAIAELRALPIATREVVVVFRTDKIGDLIVTTPLIRAIKAHSPEAYVLLVASPYNQAVLANMPEIDRIVAFDDRAGWRQKLAFASALRSLKPHAMFVMSPKPDGYWIARFTGATWRGGVVMNYHTMQRLTAPLLLNAVSIINRAKLDRTPDRRCHVSEIALNLAARGGYPRPADITLSAPTSADDRAWAAIAAPGHPILLHLGGTWGVCGLNPLALAALAQRITTTFPQKQLVMTAGPADQEYADSISAALPDAALFTALPFGQWNALIERAALVVTPDTGAVHLASAHQRPVVAVYVDSRHNAMTSLFGPWQTPYRTLRGGADAAALQDAIIKAMAELAD